MKKITAKVLVLGTIMLSCGASFMWPINTIFIHNYLHKSLAVAGIVLFFNSLCNFIGNYIGGKMFDRLGGHKTAMINASIALIALMGLIINHNWPAFPVFLSMLGFGIGGTYTVINSSAAFIGVVDRYKVFNNIYMGSKIGSLIGTAICSVIVEIQISLVFVADFICVLSFLVMAYFLYNNPAKLVRKNLLRKFRLSGN
ncbi:MAG TPA: MFS transporter [Companilactobacillus farciminis]|uniref:MFS transporter n=1 Tax=Companilactobacillus farciminis TaxID=1612 RepID=A0A921HPG0_9LACO|nr:MFS transporter [Companilactobacillus farciminis]